jgi:ATP-dependent RNA helicase DeaD
VGAITGETGLSGQAIGSIDLYDRFAFVEVPGENVEQVLTGMRHVKIRNRPVKVKLATPRGHAPERPKRAHKHGAPKRKYVA